MIQINESLFINQKFIISIESLVKHLHTAGEIENYMFIFNIQAGDEVYEYSSFTFENKYGADKWLKGILNNV